MNREKDVLLQALEAHHLTLAPAVLDCLKALIDLFLDWNQKINLSAIREEREVILKHVVDSLLLIKHLSLSGKRVIDLGSGGGFPVLPLACVYKKEASFTAVESVQKKARAISDMARSLGLPLSVVAERIEVLGQRKDFRERFEVATARALAPWPVLLEYALPFVKKGGVFIAYQGPKILEDLETYKGLEALLGGSVLNVIPEKLQEASRYFVVVKKVANTPKTYPRATGIPKKFPLTLNT